MATRAILFDLDGTLVDTREASWQLFAETNLAFALGIDSREAYFRAFEGNFFESLARICPDPARAAEVKAHFMELLRTRYHPGLIPGMVDVVRALAPCCTLAVVSTNGMEAIRRILVGAGIAHCFSHVFAGDVEPRKAASIRRFLADQRYAVHRRCSPDYQDGVSDTGPFGGGEVVLVTDTVGDVVEAREAGVRAIGVSWGMHGERQLLEAGAERVALWPQELVAWLREGMPAADGSACGLVPAPQDALSAATPAPSAGAGASPPGTRPACACQQSATTGVGETCSCQAAPLAASAIAADAGRLRRERQLQSRRAAAAGAEPRSAFPSPQRPAGIAIDAELLSAVKTILGGDASVNRHHPP